MPKFAVPVYESVLQVRFSACRNVFESTWILYQVFQGVFWSATRSPRALLQVLVANSRESERRASEAARAEFRVRAAARVVPPPREPPTPCAPERWVAKTCRFSMRNSIFEGTLPWGYSDNATKTP